VEYKLRVYWKKQGGGCGVRGKDLGADLKIDTYSSSLSAERASRKEKSKGVKESKKAPQMSLKEKRKTKREKKNR
jgi:hypothetical protein